MNEPTLYFRCVEIEDMARHLSIDLWGCTAKGDALRIAPKGSRQPTGVMTREEIRSLFLDQFDVVPQKPQSLYMAVRPKGMVSIVARAGKEQTDDGA